MSIRRVAMLGKPSSALAAVLENREAFGVQPTDAVIAVPRDLAESLIGAIKEHAQMKKPVALDIETPTGRMSSSRSNIVFGMPYGMSAKTVEKKIDERTKYVIFDIDGVIADDRHRLHFINGVDEKKCRHCGERKEGHVRGLHCYKRGEIQLTYYDPITRKNWKGYFEAMFADQPIENNIEVLRALHKQFKVVFVTGRPEKYRSVTETWLKASDVPYDALVMRPEGNYKKNAELKGELFVNSDDVPWGSQTVAVFEDNPEAVEMYRGLGFNVCQLPSAH